MTSLDLELRACWGIGYQKLKDIIRDMYDNHPEYRDLALCYMKAHPVSEFRSRLGIG